MKIEIEKPVVPKFVAEWIERVPTYYNVRGALNLVGEEDAKDIFDWCRDVDDYPPYKTLVTAFLYGYEVEKEQKYNVKFKVKSSFGTVGIFLYKEGDEVLAGDNFRAYHPKEDEYRLTEQEIRDFQNGDVLFEHFAVRVEEAE